MAVQGRVAGVGRPEPDRPVGALRTRACLRGCTRTPVTGPVCPTSGSPIGRPERGFHRRTLPSSPATASVVPRCANATACTAPTPGSSRCPGCQLRVSQIRTVPSDTAAASHSPRALNASPLIRPPRSISAGSSGRPVRGSHRRTAPSSVPTISVRPSAAKASALTGASVGAAVRPGSSRCVRGSQNRTVPRNVPAANRSPRGTEGDGRDRALVSALRCPDVRGSTQVPERERTRLDTHRETRAIRVVGQPRDRHAEFDGAQHVDLPAGARVPDARRAVLAAGDEHPPVTAELQAGDVAGVAAKHARLGRQSRQCAEHRGASLQRRLDPVGLKAEERGDIRRLVQLRHRLSREPARHRGPALRFDARGLADGEDGGQAGDDREHGQPAREHAQPPCPAPREHQFRALRRRGRRRGTHAPSRRAHRSCVPCHSSAAASRAARYRSPGSRPRSSHSRAASLSGDAAAAPRRPARASPAAAATRRSSASCATSTVPALTVSSRRCGSTAATRCSSSSSSSSGTRRRTTALARALPGEPQQESGAPVPLGLVELLERLLGQPRDRPPHAARRS